MAQPIRSGDEQMTTTYIFTLMSYLIDDTFNWFAAEIAPQMDDYYDDQSVYFE